jgi:hypothetical protein
MSMSAKGTAVALIGFVAVLGVIAARGAGTGTPPADQPAAAPAPAPTLAPGPSGAAPEKPSDDATPWQGFDPAKCGEQSADCLRSWYHEYRDAILNELEEWQSPLAFAAIKNHDHEAAESFLNTAVHNGWYVHNHWGFPKDMVAIRQAGISYDDYDALVVDCREAIIKLKFALAAVAFPHRQDNSYADYRENVAKCQKRFHVMPGQTAH